MSLDNLKSLANELFQSAGIQINGPQPWDIQIHEDEFYSRVFKDHSLGFGETYMDKWWDCKRLDQFFERIFVNHLEEKIESSYRLLFKIALAKIFNQQTKTRSLDVGRKHYDLGNRLFEKMLDTRMIYSCGYWLNATNLDEAQINKLELSCRKLRLKPKMRLLDIGCGFGSLAKYAAENYDVEVVGITISQQQLEYAQQNCVNLPIEIRLQDYRDISEKFDRIISIGMFEHVGQLNYPQYFKTVRDALADDGLFLLHTIGGNVSQAMTDEWIAKYIFPNGLIPSITQIGRDTEGVLVMEDWHNFGADYDKTLMAWHANFNQHWDSLKEEYDERFYRMWNYYLLACAASFRSRQLQLWQIVFSKNGIPGGYQAPRELK